ncbi:bifunctional 2-polyprenyl-6-hydroxyphenol methylase/3-demethylubiquinol 3-O-methyltransferase UbiG [Thioalkalivibrio sp. AKL19]|uniref:class I SAM-dependent methyltransferase n=1 Tax=Thioalkalivibrio sp. AKL19 TaxID=1266914 RepID=UPI0009DB804D|nr:class I SAM-dependent methyltransferase [Thioalkalivibrio sp. AKL19]
MSNANDIATRWYGTRAKVLVGQYEAVRFEAVHRWLLPHLPEATLGSVLDVGAGSGRDAAAFAERGYSVVAVEPTDLLREEAQRLHPHSRIEWIDDRLPHLSQLRTAAYEFQLILLSAVWMHVAPEEREKSLGTLLGLLASDGVLAFTLRLAEPEAERGMYGVSMEELESLAVAQGLQVIHSSTNEDALNRKGIMWAEIAFRRGAKI